jgi:hypothetical protein
MRRGRSSLAFRRWSYSAQAACVGGRRSDTCSGEGGFLYRAAERESRADGTRRWSLGNRARSLRSGCWTGPLLRKILRDADLTREEFLDLLR